jgi:hypothetical protein
MPFQVTWFRSGGEGYIVQNDVKTKVDVPLKDLEDILIEKLYTNEVVFKASEVIYTGLPAFYFVIDFPESVQYRIILLKDNYQIIKIECEKDDSLSIMLYEHLFPFEKELFDKEMAALVSLSSDINQKSDSLEKKSATEEQTFAEGLQENSYLYYEFERFISFFVQNYTLRNLEVQDYVDYSVLQVLLELPDYSSFAAVLVISTKQYTNPSRIPETILQTVPKNYRTVKSETEKYAIYIFGETETVVLDGLLGKILAQIER